MSDVTENTHINRADILNDTCWLFYCICQGVGIGPLTPFVVADEKVLCLHNVCTTADLMGDYACFSTQENCCCISEQCAFPPAQGTPKCICCGKWCSDARETGTVSKLKLFEMKPFIEETFWCYYIFCFGCGVNKCQGPCLRVEWKECCCAGGTGLVAPIEDGILCSTVESQLCIWSECQMPPSPGNPKCAICSWRLSKEKAYPGLPKSSMPPVTSATPVQMTMASPTMTVDGQVESE